MLAATPDHPLRHVRYPRSNAYDPTWVIENQMGPNALWLVEALTEVMDITSDMKVLDLGCGRAVTSIFLAREFGARVWATDLWISASDNQRRIVDAGLEDRVTPIHAEAHTLPYANEFFDAIVSLDAYQYFGTADLYLGYVVELLKNGGQIGAVMPAMLRDPDEVPAHLVPFWDWEFCCFHSPQWWWRHWAKTGKVRVDHADALQDGWSDWLRFNDITAPTVSGWRADAAASTHAMLDADRGEHLGFTRIVATRTET
jgi:cyclopropane fatty-acyl-phospholipid synthase-like methyltransferase